MTVEKLDELLRNWGRLNKDIMSLSEDTIAKLMAREKVTRGRLRILMRLYNRLSKLRAAREKVELMKSVKA